MKIILYHFKSKSDVNLSEINLEITLSDFFNIQSLKWIDKLPDTSEEITLLLSKDIKYSDSGAKNSSTKLGESNN